MKAIEANIGCTAIREVAAATFVFALATVLFAGQGVSSFFSTEILGLKENVLPIQVALTLATYALLQVFEPRFRALPIVTRHPLISVLVTGILIVTFINGQAFGASADEIKAPAQLVVGLVIFHLGFFFASNPNYLSSIFSAAFLAVGLSGLVALFEFATGISMPWARGSIVDRLAGEGAQGLEWFPVSYAYSVLVALLTSAYYLFVPQAWYGRPARVLCLFCLVFGGLGLIASESRSGLVGLMIGCSVVYLVSPFRSSQAARWVAFSLVVGPIAAIASVSLLSWLGKGDISDDARLHATYAVYLPLVVTHPLGVTDRDLTQLNTFFDAQEKLGLELPLETILLGTAIAPHNGFMTAGVRYGWLGVAVCFAIFGTAAFRTYHSLQIAGSELYPETHLQLALLGAVIAILVHVWFHNMSILSGDMRNWFPFGLIFGCLNLRAVRAELAKRAVNRTQSPLGATSYPAGKGGSSGDFSHYHVANVRSQSGISSRL